MTPARLLFVYRFCGMGGVESSILTKLSALRAAGAHAQVLFSEYYGQGGESIAREEGVFVGLSTEETSALLAQHFDAIFVIDYPEFIGMLHRTGVTCRVFYESHCPVPESALHFHNVLHAGLITAVVVPSVFNQRLLQRQPALRKPVHIIPNAINVDLFLTAGHASIAARQPDDDAGPILLWIGRLEYSKNPEEFLRVASSAFAAHPDLRCVLVGDAPRYDETVEALLRDVPSGMRSRVELRRAVPYAEMPELYRRAARSGGCLVSTSRHEAQPMVMLEAWASGCPVVASRVDGTVDLITDGENGHLYHPGDIADAVRQIGRIIDPGATAGRESLIRAGQSQIRTVHAPATIASRYLQLLETAAPRSAEPADAAVVSVVMIFLNGEQFIDEAIQSVLAQTYPHWELLLIDDGSTDRSSAIARAYALQDPSRIRYLEHAQHGNLGKLASRNLGLRNARGAYVAFLDHDDVWLTTKLADQVALLTEWPEAAMVYGRTHYWHSWTGLPDDEERDGFTVLGVEADALAMPPYLLTRFLEDERTIASLSSVLVRRFAALGVGGFPVDARTNLYDDCAFFAKLYLTFAVFVASGNWDRYRQHTANSCAVHRLNGHWHPTRPNAEKGQFLRWLEGVVSAHGCDDPALHDALRNALAPYRHPTARSLEAQFLEASLDGMLAILRGEDFSPPLEPLADLTLSSLDPQRVAEEMFDAVPASTWNAPSLLLRYWPEVESRVVAFLQTLEQRAAAPHLASRTHGILRTLVHGTWLLRVADGNEAALVFDGDAPDRIRVNCTRSLGVNAWDVQLNRPRLQLSAGTTYALHFRAKADRPRSVGLGVAMAHAPWENLGFYRALLFGTEWETHTFEFTATMTEPNARVHFDLGDDAEAVSIEALRVTSLNPRVNELIDVGVAS